MYYSTFCCFEWENYYQLTIQVSVDDIMYDLHMWLMSFISHVSFVIGWSCGWRWTNGVTDGMADHVAIIITSGLANDELVTSVIDYVRL